MSESKIREDGMIELDTTDVDRWVGKPLGGGILKDPIHPNDVRRWAQGMQNPNPLYFEEEYAAASPFGRMVAPQSFAVCTDTSHGAGPAIQGVIPGQHMIFGGDEWWFFGPRLEPGDEVTHDRMLFDYKVADTKFSGPTMFSRGDTTYIKQTGEVVCKQRSTSVRYLAENARKKGFFADRVRKEWTEQELEELEKQKMDYYQSFLDLAHDKRLFVKVGDKLPTRPIGPHTIASFTTEWRAYIMTVWGASRKVEALENSTLEAGWLPEMSRDLEAAKIDPAYGDGLYRGPSRGHVQEEFAQLIGMPREYGYGASMGAWILDYLTNWAGEWGFVAYSNFAYRNPALTSDATFLDGEVVGLEEDRNTGRPKATVKATMTNQDGEVMAKGSADILLPAP
ncbi:MAG: MaoC family dehydratase N-terminal domain-containing protein [Myxococcota bacterium]|nr:MaoC family dehydratase N-terminal domain-containing protein [Myxococcota bacterium]MDP7073581.1 MaoC family dehydratase N-terminal domain-containing protein [Myxococcota bacterium]MDP7431837.1 MaoC family dehydratase N-terminal domain-containing protein [Myxococcota bacterium]